MSNFYPDIFDFLETVKNSKSVTTKNLEEIIAAVKTATGLSKEACKEIVRLYFQEIRIAMLRGETVVLRGFGKFYVASPRNGSKRKIFPKFEAYGKLLDKVNE